MCLTPGPGADPADHADGAGRLPADRHLGLAAIAEARPADPLVGPAGRARRRASGCSSTSRRCCATRSAAASCLTRLRRSWRRAPRVVLRAPGRRAAVLADPVASPLRASSVPVARCRLPVSGAAALVSRHWSARRAAYRDIAADRAAARGPRLPAPATPRRRAARPCRGAAQHRGVPADAQDDRLRRWAGLPHAGAWPPAARGDRRARRAADGAARPAAQRHHRDGPARCGSSTAAHPRGPRLGRGASRRRPPAELAARVRRRDAAARGPARPARPSCAATAIARSPRSTSGMPRWSDDPSTCSA